MDRIESIRSRILEAVAPLPQERVPATHAGGRWLGAPVVARRAAPPFDCAAMDGYAVRAHEVSGTASLQVTVTLFAGDEATRGIGPGEAARVFTGAPLPAGADAVVPEEVVREEGGRAQFSRPVRAGQNVRRAGEDVAAGGLALAAGVRLRARQLGLLTAVGADAVEVVRVARVSLLTTGDEVVGGRTPDSNGAALAFQLAAEGLEVLRRQVGDDVRAVAAALGDALAAADAVVTVGGVSVGARDHVPAALGSLGGEVQVHGVPMKPGKPFLFARAGGTPVFGLPGSPSACLVAFEVFARPALLRMAGAARPFRRRAHLPLAEPVEGRAGRARFLWARLDGDGCARPIGRDAAQVRGPAEADLLLHLREGSGELKEGDRVEAWILEEGV